MPNELRTTLRELGLSQSGLARTLVAWGDDRGFDVILRWVQRAMAGDDGGPHLPVVLRLLHSHANRRRSLLQTLRQLESGSMRTRRNLGNGWEDTTAATLAETKRQIGVIEELLAECRLDKAMRTIPLADLDAVLLGDLHRIYVAAPEDEDSIYLVWEGRQLLLFVAQDAPGTLVEDGVIEVTSLDPADIEPVYAALGEAGGARGIVRGVAPYVLDDA